MSWPGSTITRLLEHVPVFYVVSLVTLVVVLVLGRQVFGSRRWIPLPGGFTLQVSEFAKLVIVLLAARYLSELKSDRPDLRDLLKLGALVALPMVLVLKQPDLGTALTYAAITAGMIFSPVSAGSMRWRLAWCWRLVLPVGWMFLKDYQKDRLTSFQDPERDPLGSGYQVIQSKIAVGSGGMWGKGVTRGAQTQLRFLPVAHTDFILSAFAEEHGFVGVAVVLGLYFLMLMQIVQNAQAAPDRAGMYICMGVCALLLFHVLVNVGMLVGRMIVTGIPLPLMSYGGSSVLTRVHDAGAGEQCPAPAVCELKRSRRGFARRSRLKRFLSVSTTGERTVERTAVLAADGAAPVRFSVPPGMPDDVASCGHVPYSLPCSDSSAWLPVPECRRRYRPRLGSSRAARAPRFDK